MTTAEKASFLRDTIEALSEAPIFGAQSSGWKRASCGLRRAATNSSPTEKSDYLHVKALR